MRISPLIASGDPVLFLMLAGLLVLAGVVLGCGISGAVLLLGKSAERKKIGKRLILAALVPLAAGVVWWLCVVGFD